MDVLSFIIKVDVNDDLCECSSVKFNVCLPISSSVTQAYLGDDEKVIEAKKLFKKSCTVTLTSDKTDNVSTALLNQDHAQHNTQI